MKRYLISNLKDLAFNWYLVDDIYLTWLLIQNYKLLN
jgi:hypothetical protein